MTITYDESLWGGPPDSIKPVRISPLKSQTLDIHNLYDLVVIANNAEDERVRKSAINVLELALHPSFAVE